MNAPAHYLQQFAGLIFDSAVAGRKWALFLLRASKPLSVIPVGLWYFRKGEVSKSLSALSRAKIKPAIVTGYIEQSEDILKMLATPLPETLTPGRSVVKFNDKVLFACHNNGKYHPNGYAIRTSEIARALAEIGITVSALTRLGYPWDLAGAEFGKITESSTYRGLQYHHHNDPDRMITKAHSQYIEAYAKYLEHIAKLENVSVIHAHSNYFNALAAQQVCAANDWLCVYELRGLWHLTRASQESEYLDSEHFRFCERMEIRAALLADKVVTLNKCLSDWLCERGVPEEKITIIPNGARKQSSYVPYQKQPGAFVIGYAGALTEYEGIDDTIRAVALLRKQGQELQFQIAGQGVYKENLIQLAEELDIAASINFLDQIPAEDIGDFYSKVDLVVLARKNMPVNQLVPPIKLAEALSYGKVVIVSDLPPLTEIIQVESCGVIVEPDNPQHLSKAIFELMQSPEQMNAIARRAFDTASSTLSWDKLVHKYVDVYSGTDKIVTPITQP